MAARVKKKALTVRIPMDMYEASSEVARRRQVSMSELVQESLQETLAAEKERFVYDMFSEIAEDLGECDVSYADAARWEVISREQE